MEDWDSDEPWAVQRVGLRWGVMLKSLGPADTQMEVFWSRRRAEEHRIWLQWAYNLGRQIGKQEGYSQGYQAAWGRR